MVASPTVYYVCGSKCGEIRMTPNAKHFQLICGFCARGYFELREFAQHIRECHYAVAKKRHAENLVVTEAVGLAAESTASTEIENGNKDPLLVNIKEEPCEELVEVRQEPVTEHNVEVDQENEQEEAQSKHETGVHTRNKQKLITIIDAIKRNPVLWNTEHADFDNAQAKAEALDNVANIMNSKFSNVELNAKTVERKLQNLHKLWRIAKDQEKKQPWYYERLKFLANTKQGETAEQSQRNCLTVLDNDVYKAEPAEAYELAKTDDDEDEDYIEHAEKDASRSKQLESRLHLSAGYTNVQIDKLIALFRQHSVLWDHKSAQYLNEFEQCLAYAEIARQMRKNFQGMYFTQKSIKKSCIDLQIMYMKMSTGKTPKLWFLKKLKFLKITENKQELQQIATVNVETLAAKMHVKMSTVDAFIKQIEKKNLKTSSNRQFRSLDSMSSCSTLAGFDEQSDAVNNEDVSMALLSYQNKDVVDVQDNLSTTVDIRDMPRNKPKANAFLWTDEVTHELIKMYKASHILWKNYVNDIPTLTKRRKQLEQIADILNRRFGVQLNTSVVRRKIHALTSIYRRGQRNSPFYKQLCFLPKGKVRPFYDCRYCEEQFTVQREWILHEYAHSRVKKFRCKQCERAFVTPAMLQVHTQMHLKPDDFKFLCHECGARFRESDRLRVHSFKHTGDWPHVCDTCEKGFATFTQLRVHMRNHTGDRPFVCEQCGKSFKTWGGINEHQRRHTGERRYPCTKCGKRFYKSQKLKEHMNIHENRRAFECNLCDKKFFKGECLRVHRLIHSTERRYSCKLCGKKFKQVAARYNHMRKKHAAAD